MKKRRPRYPIEYYKQRMYNAKPILSKKNIWHWTFYYDVSDLTEDQHNIEHFSLGKYKMVMVGHS
jgi:hypothetical protein